jgi:hypothetical protein
MSHRLPGLLVKAGDVAESPLPAVMNSSSDFPSGSLIKERVRCDFIIACMKAGLWAISATLSGQ